MRDCINAVGDRLGLGHTWCNCDFKHTKSYTDAIFYHSHLYKSFDRLVVRMVDLDLLLAMKLIAFREHKRSDLHDCRSIISIMKQGGSDVSTEFICDIVNKYFSVDDLSSEAKKFIGLG